MDPGDYLVHVLVQLHRNLLLPGEDTCDPYVKISCLNVDKQTSVKNDITISAKTKIDEHLFLEIKGAKKEDLEKAQLKIEVLNKGFFKGDLIGEFEMALTKVYNSKDHSILH